MCVCGERGGVKVGANLVAQAKCILLSLCWLGTLIESVLLSPSRTRPRLHSLPSSCHASTVASALVRVLFCHDHPARHRWTSKLLLSWMSFPEALAMNMFLTSDPLQFIGLESIITSLSDIFPSQIRKGYRRELLLLLICSFCYVVGLLLVSQVNSVFALMFLQRQQWQSELLSFIEQKVNNILSIAFSVLN